MTRLQYVPADALCVSTALLTGGEGRGAGWVARPSIIEGSDLDGAHVSTLGWKQGAGAGRGVTGEVLVARHQVQNGFMRLLLEFPGNQESRYTITHHHGDVSQRWHWGSCLKTKHKEADF